MIAAVVAFGPGGAGSDARRPVRPALPVPSGTAGGTGAGSAAPAATGPNGAPLAFSAGFSGTSLLRSKWNPFVTDAAAAGQPWNTNGRGGSTPANSHNLQDYEYDLPRQVHVDHELRIVAQRRPTAGMLGPAALTYPWRSGAVSTYGKFEFDGGFLEVVARMPTAPGMWPSVFLLPGYSMAGQPDADEIDLFEGGYTGKGPAADNVAWHLHTAKGVAGGVTDVGTSLSSGFHTYALDWVPGKSITWYFDGRTVGRVTSAQLPVPNEPMELILDLQVANPATASFHTLVGSSTPSTDTMVVRRVVVYSRS